MTTPNGGEAQNVYIVGGGASDPQDLVPVTKSDSTTLTDVLGLRVTATGTLVVKNAIGTSRTIVFVEPVEYFPLAGVTKIMATGSTIADADVCVWKATAA